MSVIFNASTSSGIGLTPDNSGVIQFQSNGANTVQIAANGALLTTGGGTLVPPATGVVTIPAGIGTVSVANVSSNLVLGTSVASTSGTSVDFTGIPVWVKRITIMLYNVSTNGTSRYLVQVGSGSVATSGYLSNGAGFGNSGGSTSGGQTSTAGHILMGWVANAANTYSGHVVITNITNNNYVISSILADTSAAPSTSAQMSAGYVSLPGLIDRVRVTTVNGTDTFDAGSINIMYE